VEAYGRGKELLLRTAKLNIARGGVPVFWREAPEPYAAALVFRVGRADEALAAAGITHLVEHLALPAQAMRPELDWNGWVGAVESGFWVSGEQTDALAFLQDVAARVGDLPFDRLEIEKNILRAEAANAPRGPVEVLAGIRFGAHGLGIVNWEEYGLYRLDERSVADWARRYFGAGNAAVWMTSAPPRDFRLDLPDGPRMPPPASRPLDLPLPAFAKVGAGGVGISFLASRSWPLGAARAAPRRTPSQHDAAVRARHRLPGGRLE
jgi:hypothetical protein